MGFFPDVPNVPGVPALPRIPPQIFDQVSSGLNGAADLMDAVSAACSTTPTAHVSTVLNSVTSASSLVNGVGSLLNQYPSTLFNQFTAPVAGYSSTLSGLVTVINGAPTNPLSSISGTVNTLSDQLDSTTFDFEEQSLAQDEPTEAIPVSESITVTATKGVTWGIVDSSGNTVVEGGNFVSLEYKQDWAIADYPIEDGGFESYDKVSLPFDARVVVSCGGPVADREAFLASIQAIAGDLKLYSIRMPEQTLSNVNVQHIDFSRRNDDGVGLLKVAIYLLEVRTNAQVGFSSTGTPASPTATKAPAGQATQSNGTVQAQDPTSAQSSAAFLNLNQLTAPIPRFQ